MSVDLSKFQAAFFDESAEHLSTMEDGLLQLEGRPTDLDLLNRIFRAAHSIKGNSGMFGFTAVGQLTHKMETVLDQLRNTQMSVTKPIIDLLLVATDGLKLLIEAAKTEGAVDEEAIRAIEVKLEAAGHGGTPPTSPSGSTSEPRRTAEPDPTQQDTERMRISWTPPEDMLKRGLDPLQVIRDLEGLGMISSLKVETGRVPDLVAIDPEALYLSWRIGLVTEATLKEIESVFEFVRDGSRLEITPVVFPTTPVSSSVPVFTENREGAGDESPPRIGEILVEEGVISRDTLSEALGQQKRLGEILVEAKAVTPQQMAQALAKQAKLAQAAPSRKAESASVRVDIEKIDKLINLVGELVITQSMLSDLGGQFTPSRLPVLQERLTQLERTTRDLQERVMSIRMMPIGTVFNRFPRLVRDLATSNGKKIRLLMSGEETELDKTVLESIGDPLTHLIRNAADHGLEPPEERVAVGKPEEGAIRLNAFHEGGNISITVSEDGRGLNREKVLAKALKQGMITENDKLTNEQAWALIFRPGFSTAEKVTDVSGRGVGMDVVKRNIEGLGGTVTIRTEAGKGTTFTLKLPLTLAIIDGLTVRVGPETYIVPLLSVIESIQPQPASVKTVVGRGELVNVRDTYHPVVRLAEAFGVKPDITDPAQAILVILETEGERVAVMVDELLGQQQVVIKSLEKNFQKVEGLAGATILGDGTVGFILDVRGLIELARHGVAVAA